MKGKTLKTILCAAVLAITMSVTACGSSNDGAENTFEAYLFEDSTAEQQLKDMAAAQGNDEMDMDIQVKGNDVICIATFKDSVELSDDAADQLKEAVNSLEDAFSAIAGSLDEAMGAEKGTVSYGIRYCASDGTVLAEASFRAK